MARIAPKRQLILDTAHRLFSDTGFASVSVDQVAQAAGVSKLTVYYHFPTKEALVHEVLENYDKAFRQQFVSQVVQKASDPRGQLLAVFDVLEDLLASGQVKGCMFLAASVEYRGHSTQGQASAGQGMTETNSPADISRKNRGQLAEVVLSLAKQAHLPDPQTIADQWMVLVDGVLANAQLHHSAKPASVARGIAKALIDGATSR